MENIEMKDIEGFEGKYAITPDGKVWSYHLKDFRTIYDNGQGYMSINLSKNSKTYKRKIHRLVAEAYIPKPDWATPGMQLDVGHLNDVRDDNRVENLYWCTRSENLDTDHFREAQKTKKFTKVQCVETGEIFPSIKAAGEAIGKNKYGINLCLLGKQQTCGGLHWKRV